MFITAVAKIEEERQAEQKEREQMQINFEQHRQLELKQQEEKKKVGFIALHLALKSHDMYTTMGVKSVKNFSRGFLVLVEL